jgi:hypothetical protein
LEQAYQTTFSYDGTVYTFNSYDNFNGLWELSEITADSVFFAAGVEEPEDFDHSLFVSPVSVPLYVYFKHTYEITLHNGDTQIAERFFDREEPYCNRYPNWKCIATEVQGTTKQYLDLYPGILLFGKYYQVSEEHTGTYVIDKVTWEEATKDFDQTIKGIAQEPDPDLYPFDEVDPEELSKLVVVDFGGQLEAYVEEVNGFTCIDEDDIPELPLGDRDDTYSNVGNG